MQFDRKPPIQVFFIGNLILGILDSDQGRWVFLILDILLFNIGVKQQGINIFLKKVKHFLQISEKLVMFYYEGSAGEHSQNQ